MMENTFPPPSTQKTPIEEEIAKLRKHNAILKKAMLLEKAENEKKTKALEDSRKIVRQTRDDQDNLSFQNQRLSKTILSLQDEINSKPKSRKSVLFNFKTGPGNEELDVMKNELETKIKENEQIHMNFFEMKSKYKKKKRDLENELNTLKEGLQSCEKENNTTIEKFVNLNQTNEKSILSLTVDLEMKKHQLENCSTELQNLEEILMKEKENKNFIQNLLNQKVYFNDTKITPYNHLNLPGFDSLLSEEIKKRTREVFKTLESTIPLYREYGRLSIDKYLFEKCETVEGKQFQQKMIQLFSSNGNHLEILLKRIKSVIFLSPDSSTKDGDDKNNDDDRPFKEILNAFILYHRELLKYIDSFNLDYYAKKIKNQHWSTKAQELNKSNNQLQSDWERFSLKLPVFLGYFNPEFQQSKTPFLSFSSEFLEQGRELFNSIVANATCLKALGILETELHPHPGKEKQNLQRSSVLDDIILSLQSCIHVLMDIFSLLSKEKTFFVRGIPLTDPNIKYLCPNDLQKTHQFHRNINTFLRDNYREEETVELQNKALNEKLLQLSQENIELTSQCAKEKGQYDKVKNKYEQLCDDKIRLKNELDEANINISSLKSGNEQLVQEKLQLKSETEDISLKFSHFQKDNNQLGNAIIDLKKENNRLFLENKEKDIENEKFKKKILQLNNENEPLKHIHDNSQQDCEEDREEHFSPLTEKIHEQCVIYDQLKHTHKELELKFQATYAERDSLIQETRMKDQEIASLQQKVQDIETLHSEAVRSIEDKRRNYDGNQVQTPENENTEADISVFRLLQKQIKDKEEEVTMLNSGYNNQIQILSEHMASLNEQIVKKDDLVSIFKQCQILCIRCKKWNSISTLVTGYSSNKQHLCQYGKHSLETFKL